MQIIISIKKMPFVKIKRNTFKSSASQSITVFNFTLFFTESSNSVTFFCSVIQERYFKMTL